MILGVVFGVGVLLGGAIWVSGVVGVGVILEGFHNLYNSDPSVAELLTFSSGSLL